MSDFSQLLHHKITFGQFITQGEQSLSDMVKHDPTLTAEAGTMLSNLKQVASDALSLADSELGNIIQPVTVSIETGLEAALALATKGLSVPFNPIINHGIETMAAQAHAAIDMWVISTKGKLAANSTVNPTPPTA